MAIAKKNFEVIADRTCFSLVPLRVRCLNASAIVPGQEERRQKIQGEVCGKERGERRKSMEKKRRRRNRESEKEEQEGREEWGAPKLFGVIAVRSHFSPFTTFSFFRAFFFFFFSYCRFKHSFERGMAAAMFFLSSACMYTYRLVCVQATFACSDRKRGKERRGGGGCNREDKKK